MTNHLTKLSGYSFNKSKVIRTPFHPLKTSFTREELQQFFEAKEVQEALFLSSPVLLSTFNKWRKGEKKNVKDENRLIYSLLKYAIRMHSRCTPFGLFAGCGIIEEIGNKVVVNPNGKRNTRLDMNFTCALAQELSKLLFIQKQLEFYPNTSIYYLHDKIRYIEYFYKDKRRIHQISAVNSSVYLEKILKKARGGATPEELANCIVEKDVTLEEALNFVSQIIDAQILVSELEPSITGDELLTQILNKIYPLERKLKGVNARDDANKLRQIIKLLKTVQSQLNKIDMQIGNPISVYETLAKNLKQLNIPFELSKLFQTDLYIDVCPFNKEKQEDGMFDSSPEQSNIVESQLIKAITILNQLQGSPSTTYLSEFQEAFYKRYEDKEVPLLEALDVEAGIGYAQNIYHTGDVNPLVNDLNLPFSENKYTKLIWNKEQSFLLKKLLKAKKNKDKIIQFTDDDDVKDFKANWEDLPESFSIMFKHLGKTNGKNLLSISSVGGSSATYLLGRFASSNLKMAKLVTDIATAEHENNPNVIYAEIAHLPESRTGNILMRPAFRQYEIPYLSNSSLPKEQQITLDDLYLSVNHNRLILRSKRLNKQIIPRLGNAHNFSFNALPVYHLLCDLQTQNQRNGLFFDWGNLANEFSFLPRVEIENVIVFSATWQLQKKQFEKLLNRSANINEEILKWQKKWELPNLILFVDGDNELPIDLNNKLSVEMFVSIIRKRPNIILKEFLFDEKTAIVKDEKGNAYTNEFIAILQKNPNTSLQDTKQPLFQENITSKIANKTIVTRTFSLGSEWLYYKIYCGVKTADIILTEVIKRLTEQFINEELIDSWFFIRYADPDIHLRVRFHLTELNHIGTVIDLFQKAIAKYEKKGLIWKIQTDTYKREIERYGVNTMFLGEQIFYYDSKCIVDMLDMIDGDEGEEIRWLFAIRMVDALLSDFNYSDEQKKDLLENLKIGFAIEFNMNKNLKKQIDKTFREHRIAIIDVLNRKKDVTSELSPLFYLLEEKSSAIKPIVNQILSLHKNDDLSMSLDDLLSSYIHMLLNRLFKNKQRLHELVVYDLMWRTYRSENAKRNHINKQSKN